MIKNEIYQKSIRWLKENDLYDKWKNNVKRLNTLYDDDWLGYEYINDNICDNIILYGFNWSLSIEYKTNRDFWAIKEEELISFLKKNERGNTK